MQRLCNFFFAMGLAALVPTAVFGVEKSPFGNKHVLIIGIDGVRPDCLCKANTPNIDRLISEGAVSYDAFAGGSLGTPTHQITVSGPGWTSILTGVWVNKHKIVNNEFRESDLKNYPHFFTRIRESVPEASLSSIIFWTPIHQYILADADFAREVKTDAAVTEEAVVHLRSADPDVLFLHFDECDAAGHKSGFSPMNPAYLQAIEKTDHYVGEILLTIQSRPNFKNEQWLTIVTTDHGGFERKHGGDRPVEREIFFITSGPQTVRKELSPGPGHTAVPPTVCAFLGIPIKPEWGWESGPFGLESEKN